MRFELSRFLFDAFTLGVGQGARALFQAGFLDRVALLEVVGVRHHARGQAGRIVEQLAHQALEVSRIRDCLFQLDQVLFVVEGEEHVAVAHRDRQRVQQARQGVGHAARCGVALAVAHVAQGRLQRLGGHALFRCALQCGPDAGARFFDLRLGQSFHAEMENHLARAVILAIERGRTTEAGRFHRLHHRRRRVAQQAGRQQVRVEEGVDIGRFAHQPRELHTVFVGLGGLRRDAHFVRFRFSPGGGQFGQHARRARCRQLGQHFFLDLLLHFHRADIAGGHEHGLRRVVMAGVEVLEHLVRQFRDHQRIAARFDFVRGAGQQRVLDAAVQRADRIVEGALHFIEHHALVTELAVLEDIAPAFLKEVQVVEVGEERGVEVHVEQVVEILAVGAGERIDGAVGVGERVHERGRGPAHHREERVAHRVALRTAQRQVLQDVGTAVADIGHGGERHEEHLFRLVAGEVNVARTGAR